MAGKENKKLKSRGSAALTGLCSKVLLSSLRRNNPTFMICNDDETQVPGLSWVIRNEHKNTLRIHGNYKVSWFFYVFCEKWCLRIKTYSMSPSNFPIDPGFQLQTFQTRFVRLSLEEQPEENHINQEVLCTAISILTGLRDISRCDIAFRQCWGQARERNVMV